MMQITHLLPRLNYSYSSLGLSINSKEDVKNHNRRDSNLKDSLKNHKISVTLEPIEQRTRVNIDLPRRSDVT